MVQPQKLFDNFFDDVRIIPTRLLKFAEFVLNHLITLNTGGQYTAIINDLTPLVVGFQAEVGDVDTSIAIQKGATLNADEFIAAFKQTMSTEEPFIARAVGGTGTAEYLQFYPKGKGEYQIANKTNMSTFVNRVNDAATTNAGALGATLTATLQAFADGWKKTRDKQEQQLTTVGDNRKDRSKVRKSLEIQLLVVIYTIAAKFPGDVTECLTFFPFNLLFAQTKHKHQTYANILSPGQIAVILNRTLTDNTSLTIRNPDDNAPFAIWLAATEKEAVPPTALIVQPGNTAEVKPSDLGNLANTFLLVKNTSEVNEGAYEVVVV